MNNSLASGFDTIVRESKRKKIGYHDNDDKENDILNQKDEELKLENNKGKTHKDTSPLK